MESDGEGKERFNRFRAERPSIKLWVRVEDNCRQAHATHPGNHEHPGRGIGPSRRDRSRELQGRPQRRSRRPARASRRGTSPRRPVHHSGQTGALASTSRRPLVEMQGQHREVHLPRTPQLSEDTGDSRRSRGAGPVSAGPWEDVIQPKPRALPPGVREKQEINTITGHQVTPGVCRLCNVAVTSLRRNALRVHLPWYFYPEIACWKCKRACACASELRCRHLSRHPEGMFNNPAQLGEWLTTLCGYVQLQATLLGGSMEDLMAHLPHHEEQKSVDFQESPLRRALMEWVHNTAYEAPHPQATVDLGLSPARAITWDAQIYLLAQIGEEGREQLRQFELLPTWMRHVSVHVADGHCHLQDLARRLGQRSPATAMTTAQELHGHRLISTVAEVVDNQVFPNAWGKVYSIPGVTIGTCIGVHPRMVNNYIPWNRLEALIRGPRCVGVGECGLDATAPELELQKELLCRQVLLAKQTGLPLVLHVRDDKDPDSLLGTVLALLKEHLEPGHLLYVHSFCGSLGMARKFISFSSNTLFGLSWASARQPTFHEVAAQVPIECLALETDAPHLPPPSYTVNSPFLLWRLARETAKHRNLPAPLILDLSRRNIRRVFKMWGPSKGGTRLQL